MSRRRLCMMIDVDGMPARVYADGALTKRDLEALREVARAARAHGLTLAHDLPPEVIAAETWYQRALERSRTHD